MKYHTLLLQNLALRQQLAMYRQKYGRPRASLLSRLFWILLKLTWSGWKQALVIVKPATVVAWHRQGWRLFWRWKSGRSPGRPPIPSWAKDLVLRLSKDNVGWGAPRIHGELKKLGISIEERSVSRILKSAGLNPYPHRDFRQQRMKTGHIWG